MKVYNKPQFEYVQLTAEERFAVGSLCEDVGICTVKGVRLRDNQ